VIDEYKTWRHFFWKQAERSLNRLKKKPPADVPVIPSLPPDNAHVIDSGHFYDIPDSLFRVLNHNLVTRVSEQFQNPMKDI
jgi:hypothetical protein